MTRIRGHQITPATAAESGAMSAVDKAYLDEVKQFIRGPYADEQAAFAAGLGLGVYYFQGDIQRIVRVVSRNPFATEPVGGELMQLSGPSLLGRTDAEQGPAGRIAIGPGLEIVNGVLRLAGAGSVVENRIVHQGVPIVHQGVPIVHTPTP